MSRTTRKTLDRPDRNNTIKSLKEVPDGKCNYRCKCTYCIKMRKKKIIDDLYLEEIKNEFYLDVN